MPKRVTHCYTTLPRDHERELNGPLLVSRFLMSGIRNAIPNSTQCVEEVVQGIAEVHFQCSSSGSVIVRTEVLCGR